MTLKVFVTITFCVFFGCTFVCQSLRAGTEDVDSITRCTAPQNYREALKQYSVSFAEEADYTCLIDVAALGETITSYQLVDTRAHGANKEGTIADAWQMSVNQLKHKKILIDKPLLLIGDEFSRVIPAHDCATLKKAGFTKVRILVGGASGVDKSLHQNITSRVSTPLKLVTPQALIFEYFNSTTLIISTSKAVTSLLKELEMPPSVTLEGSDEQKINDWAVRNAGGGFNPVVVIGEATPPASKMSHTLSNVYWLEGGVEALGQQLEGNVWINHNRTHANGGFVCGKK